MPWTRARFRDDEVIACCHPDGTPLAGGDGFVPFMYRPGGKQYKTRPDKLTPVSGAPVVDDFMSLGANGGNGGGRGGNGSTARRPAKSAKAGGGGGPAGAKLPTGDYTSRRADTEAVQVWTDGACSGNPGPAGLGVVVLHQGDAREASEYLGIGTNNIAELTAILRGLEIAAEMTAGSAPIDVITDSSYAIGLLGKGWKPKKNQELVAKLRDEVAKVADIRLLKVPGHAGVPLNERADELAREAIALNT